MKKIWKAALSLSLLLAAGAIPAMADVVVNTPLDGAQVAPQFTLSANATTCSGQRVGHMGFSLDSSGTTTTVKGTSINAQVTATTGPHALHVKAWGNKGAVCVTDVAITVVTPSSTPDGVTVTSPTNNSTVPSPFTVNANALTCSSQPVSSMGYSLDYGSTVMVSGTAINASATAADGAHTLHVKAWGNAGSVCVTDVAINVSTPTTSTGTTLNGVTVTSPLINSTVASPFALSAAASQCSSQTVTAMGYSLDNSTNTAIVQSAAVQASVTASAGAHTLHVKAWGNSGAVCVADIPITVSTSTIAPTSDVTISSPANGSSVTSPFVVAASATTCSSQAVTSIGYALDSASSTISTGTSLNTQISASGGAHTLNVTAWGSGGAACNASVTINVTSSTSPTNTIVPSNAISVSSIQALSNWQAANDPATGGSTSGTMTMVSSPSLSGNARQFNTTFSNSGGELYHITFGDDTAATNFFYDGWVYLTSSASNIANLEIDMNQVTSNGQTVIYGFQCDGYSGTWDYTENAGTPTSPSDHWVHSSAGCNPRNWTTNAWHHIQVSYSRDSSGNVTYHSVWFDGAENPINATVPSSFALGWAPVLLTNFQVDGIGSGSNTVYLDNLTISRW